MDEHGRKAVRENAIGQDAPIPHPEVPAQFSFAPPVLQRYLRGVAHVLDARPNSHGAKEAVT